MAGRPPPSFKTDVHRNPTKKWADAKAFSYEGDDWGNDEYGEYDEPPPPPKPTGLRQRGQVVAPLTTTNQDTSGASSWTAPVASSRARSNSYEAGDESRSFSAGTVPSGPTGEFGVVRPGPYLPSSPESSSPSATQAFGREPLQAQGSYANVKPFASPNLAAYVSSRKSAIWR